MNLSLINLLFDAAPASAISIVSIPFGHFQNHTATTLLQKWGLLLIVLGILAFAKAWHLMCRRSRRKTSGAAPRK